MQILLALRAAIFFGAGIFITFSADHGYLIGQQVLAVTTGLFSVAVFSLIAFGKPVSKADLMLGIIGFLVTLLALFTISSPDLLLYSLVTLWGLASAFVEVFAARDLGFKTREGKDRVLSAVLSVGIGLLLLFPLDVVSAVGFMGAYFVIAGVHWGIASATPKQSRV